MLKRVFSSWNKRLVALLKMRRVQSPTANAKPNVGRSVAEFKKYFPNATDEKIERLIKFQTDLDFIIENKINIQFNEPRF